MNTGRDIPLPSAPQLGRIKCSKGIPKNQITFEGGYYNEYCPHHICYVEPFCGAAAILFAKEPSKVEVLNDTNLDLVTLFRVLQHHLEEFVRHFKWVIISRPTFEWFKATPPNTLTDIQRAVRFYYLQRMAFGGKVKDQAFGAATISRPHFNLLRIEENLSQAHLRLARVYIESLNWRTCIDKYDRPHTLFYLDPPYWGTEDYGVDFSLEQYTLIAERMRAIKGKAILSVNDIAEMTFDTVKWFQTATYRIFRSFLSHSATPGFLHWKQLYGFKIKGILETDIFNWLTEGGLLYEGSVVIRVSMVLQNKARSTPCSPS